MQYMSLCFLLQTVPPDLAGVVLVVVGVVSIGIIIASAVVFIVCLLVVGKSKLKKNSLGEDEDCTSTILHFVHWCCFFTAPIVYWTRNTTKERFVL